MEDIQLPRHVIDRLENRWASRLRQDARARSSTRLGPLSPAMCNSTALGLFPLEVRFFLRASALHPKDNGGRSPPETRRPTAMGASRGDPMAMAEAWHGIEAWAAAVRPPPTVTPRIANQPTCSQFVTGRHAAVFGLRKPIGEPIRRRRARAIQQTNSDFACPSVGSCPVSKQ